MIKKNDFEKLWETMIDLLDYIDKRLTKEKPQLNCLDKNLKAILLNIEKDAIKEVSKKHNLTENTIKERWKILSLPAPFIHALESGSLSYSKIKPLCLFNLDFESDKDIEVSEKIVNFIKRENPDNKKLKEVVQQELNNSKIWNESDVVIKRIAQQHGIKNA